MANSWLRLWHDMPTDPKWRTIARHSGQHIGLVQSTYVHLLVDASRNVTRGHATVTTEDLASALDCEESQIQAVIDAMQGRVLDGLRITGWDVRQPKKEDVGSVSTGAKSATERKREQRERSKQTDVTLGHGMSRDVTTDKDKDKEEDKDIKEAKASLSSGKPEDGKADDDTKPLPPPKVIDCPHLEILGLFAQHLPEMPQPKPEMWTGQRANNLKARWRWVMTATNSKTGNRYAETKEQALDFFGRFFAYVSRSDFLMGRSGAWSNCDLVWLTKAENFAKVIQGNYENKEAA